MISAIATTVVNETDVLLPTDPMVSDIDRKKLYRGVTYLGICFALIFTAYNTIQSYVTTLYVDLGFYILLVAYANFGISSFLASRIHRLTARFVHASSVERVLMGIASGCYVLFILSAASTNEVMALFGAVLVGWGAGLLWISQGVYLTKLVMGYNDDVLGTMTGIFFSIYNLNGLIGNTIALLYLYTGGDLVDLVFVMAGVGVLATIMMLATQRTKYPSSDVLGLAEPETSFRTQITQVKRFITTRETLLLAPYCVNAGLTIAFVSGNFPTYVTFATKTRQTGTDQQANINVAWNSLVYGIGGLISSVVSGRMFDYFERRLTPLILSHLFMTLIIFTLAPAVIILDELAYPVSVFPCLMIVSFVFGLSDFLVVAIINSSISAFYQGRKLVWAFSGYRLLFCIGFVIHAALSGILPGVYDYETGEGFKKYGWLILVAVNIVATLTSVACAYGLTRTQARTHLV